MTTSQRVFNAGLLLVTEYFYSVVLRVLLTEMSEYFLHHCLHTTGYYTVLCNTYSIIIQNIHIKPLPKIGPSSALALYSVAWAGILTRLRDFSPHWKTSRGKQEGQTGQLFIEARPSSVRTRYERLRTKHAYQELRRLQQISWTACVDWNHRSFLPPPPTLSLYDLDAAGQVYVGLDAVSIRLSLRYGLSRLVCRLVHRKHFNGVQ